MGGYIGKAFLSEDNAAARAEKYNTVADIPVTSLEG